MHFLHSGILFLADEKYGQKRYNNDRNQWTPPRIHLHPNMGSLVPTIYFYKKEHGKCLEEYIERWFYPVLNLQQLRLRTNLANMT